MSLLSNIKAQKAINIENYDNAIAICESAILKNDKDVESLEMLAHCYERKGDLEKANTIAEKGLQLDMTDFSLLMISVRYWYSVKNWDNTYMLACKALKNTPMDIPPFPGWLKSITIFISKFEKFKHLRTMTEEGLIKRADENKNIIKWLFEYTEWYERQHASNGDSTLH